MLWNFYNDITTFWSLHFLSSRKENSKPKSISIRNFSADNVNALNDLLLAMSWINFTSLYDPQESCSNFLESFSLLHDVYFPLSSKNFNCNIHKIEPWFTNGLLISRRTKITLGKNHFMQPSDASLAKFNIYRNIYNKLTYSAKKLYFQRELFLNQSNL